MYFFQIPLAVEKLMDGIPIALRGRVADPFSALSRDERTSLDYTTSVRQRRCTNFALAGARSFAGFEGS